MRFVPVAANAATAEAVFVDFVDDITGTIGVGKARCVNGTAEAVWGEISYWKLGTGRGGEGRKR